MDRAQGEATRVNPHTPEQEDEQLRRFWRRADPRATRGAEAPREGYAEESDASERAGWGPL